MHRYSRFGSTHEEESDMDGVTRCKEKTIISGRYKQYLAKKKQKKR